VPDRVAGTLLRVDSTVLTRARLSGVTGLPNRDAERFGRLEIEDQLECAALPKVHSAFCPWAYLPTWPVVSLVMDRTLQAATAKLATGIPERDAYCAYRHNRTAA